MSGKGILQWTAESLFALSGLLVVWAARAMGWVGWKLLKAAYQHPRTTVGLAGAGAFVWGFGWVLGVWALGIAVVTASTWRAAHRASFDRFLGRWLLTWWRRWVIYRRRWAHTMSVCGLTVQGAGESKVDAVPALHRVKVTTYWDFVTADLRAGHEIKTVRDASEKLRTAWRARRCQVEEIEPGRVRLALMRKDPFVTERVGPAPIPRTAAEVDFTKLFVGRDEFLEPVHVSVVGGHLVSAGSPGSGKASLQGSVIRQLVPAIAAGLVRLVLIDPKGMELRQVRELAAADDYAVTATQTVALLQRLVTEMDQAGIELGEEGERDFVPSTAHPLTLIVVDELAAPLAYWPRSVVRDCDDLLSRLAAFGRAPGFIQVGCIQEPTKDVFRTRDLFGTRFALRLPNGSTVDAALCDDAVDLGARAHEISIATPGVAYRRDEVTGLISRMRFAHITNDDLSEARTVYRQLTNADQTSAAVLQAVA